MGGEFIFFSAELVPYHRCVTLHVLPWGKSHIVSRALSLSLEGNVKHPSMYLPHLTLAFAVMPR